MFDPTVSRRILVLGILLVALPAAVGLIAFLAYRSGWLHRMIIYLRISTDNLALVIGLFLSIVGFCFFGITLLFRAQAQRRIEMIRQQAREERRQFLLRLDHELKNPLTTLRVEIANLGNEVQSETGQSSELAPSFQRLEEQTTRLSNLGIQLRKLAELESHPLEKESVDLAGLLEELAEEFSTSNQSRRIQLNLPQVPWPLPQVEVDADLIYLAFHNLLGNAIKFTRPSDSIQVRAFEYQEGIVVEIADSGPGIPESELPHIWEELYRGQLARQRAGSSSRASDYRTAWRANIRTESGRPGHDRFCENNPPHVTILLQAMRVLLPLRHTLVTSAVYTPEHEQC